MLTIYRRHTKNCQHKTEGRQYRRCRCPIWVDGFLNGVEMRKSLGLRDWEKAPEEIRKWEAEGEISRTDQPVTIAQACEAFLEDAAARNLRDGRKPTVDRLGSGAYVLGRRLCARLFRLPERGPPFARGRCNPFPRRRTQLALGALRLGLARPRRLHRRPTCPLRRRDPPARRRAHRSLSGSRSPVSNWLPMVQSSFKVRDGRLDFLLLNLVSDQRHCQQICVCPWVSCHGCVQS